jgi:hypothetical protein
LSAYAAVIPTKTNFLKEKYKSCLLCSVHADTGTFAHGSTVYSLSIEMNDSSFSARRIVLEPTAKGSSEYYRREYFRFINAEDDN